MEATENFSPSKRLLNKLVFWLWNRGVLYSDVRCVSKCMTNTYLNCWSLQCPIHPTSRHLPTIKESALCKKLIKAEAKLKKNIAKDETIRSHSKGLHLETTLAYVAFAQVIAPSTPQSPFYARQDPRLKIFSCFHSAHESQWELGQESQHQRHRTLMGNIASVLQKIFILLKPILIDTEW